MKLVIYFLLILSTSAYGLVPLEGILYGNVRDIPQYDPFSGMFSFNYTLETPKETHREKFNYLQALTMQGMELKNKCEKTGRVRYTNQWKKLQAVKSVTATLQYIGIDVTTRAIASYARKSELKQTEYMNLVTNIITNYCSDNISVYSKKLIKD